MAIYIDFKELYEIRKNLKKKGYRIEEVLLFLASQIDKDLKDGVNVETYCDLKSDREIEIAMYASGRRK